MGKFIDSDAKARAAVCDAVQRHLQPAPFPRVEGVGVGPALPPGADRSAPPPNPMKEIIEENTWRRGADGRPIMGPNANPQIDRDRAHSAQIVGVAETQQAHGASGPTRIPTPADSTSPPNQPAWWPRSDR